MSVNILSVELLSEINWFAVLTGTLAAYAFGALWYSPLLFLRSWSLAANLNDKLSPGPVVFASGFLLTLLAATALAVLLGPAPQLWDSLILSLLCGGALICSSIGVNYLFAGRSLRLWLIDGGFQIGRFLLIGLALGLGH
ncbi:DUF1761 domain-containing protein [Kiloniella laminariae]|uniref:DUF1761 domain-containing protein n=1 Tax=Kiloniella laminariae TaxID=454162 RepID=UPI000378BDE5|nr:DUF1761 domain-containing protein [Kiloniella laminariae]